MMEIITHDDHFGLDHGKGSPDDITIDKKEGIAGKKRALILKPDLFPGSMDFIITPLLHQYLNQTIPNFHHRKGFHAPANRALVAS